MSITNQSNQKLPLEVHYSGVGDGRESIRSLERASIRIFMEHAAEYLTGRVLDFGAGTQPYKDMVVGEYFAYDPQHGAPDMPPGQFDAVMCNQVFQYCEYPEAALDRIVEMLLKPGGHLVMTYPTTWTEIEPNDFFRFTKVGMEHLIRGAGLNILIHEPRVQISLHGFLLNLGYGVVARKAEAVDQLKEAATRGMPIATGLDDAVPDLVPAAGAGPGVVSDDPMEPIKEASKEAGIQIEANGTVHHPEVPA